LTRLTLDRLPWFAAGIAAMGEYHSRQIVGGGIRVRQKPEVPACVHFPHSLLPDEHLPPTAGSHRFHLSDDMLRVPTPPRPGLGLHLTSRLFSCSGSLPQLVGLTDSLESILLEFVSRSTELRNASLDVRDPGRA
jgi:hypothetical protein